MPFGFLKRRKDDDDAAKAKAPAPRRRRAVVAFEGLTEEWRLVGRMHVEGRMTDALNKRESITDLRGPLGADRRLGALATRPGSRHRPV